jgi:hypothetical protein
MEAYDIYYRANDLLSSAKLLRDEDIFKDSAYTEDSKEVQVVLKSMEGKTIGVSLSDKVKGKYEPRADEFRITPESLIKISPTQNGIRVESVKLGN